MEGQSPGNAAAIPVPAEDETMSLLSNPVVGEPSAAANGPPREGEVLPLSPENLARLALQNCLAQRGQLDLPGCIVERNYDFGLGLG